MILPGAMLGLLGGGQLGRMFTTRAQTMGYQVTVLDPDPDSPAGRIATRHLRAPYQDHEALDTLAGTCRAVTTEFENVPAEVLEQLASRVMVSPPPFAVAVAQDRIREKEFLQRSGIPTAPFAAVETEADLEPAWRQVGAPALLKTSRMGYDGKGQVAVTDREGGGIRQAWQALGRVPCVLERRLDLEAELSVVLARGRDGSTAAFPPGENVHRNGILHTTTVPSCLPPEVAAEAERVAVRIANALEYVGVLGVELFVADGGRLFANELAPRPHNSGHYTLDACVTDQFEQQVRSLCGLPLGDPALLSPACMVNLLGDLWAPTDPPWDRALALPGAKLHLYGKRDARPGRKMGHLTCLGPTPAAARETALEGFVRLGGWISVA